MSPSGTKCWEDRATGVLEPQLLHLQKVPFSPSCRFPLGPTATTATTRGSFGAWTGQNEEKERKQKKKIRRFPPSFRAWGCPLHLLETELGRSSRSPLLASVLTEFQPALRLGQRTAEGKKLLNSLSIWRYFKVGSSSPTHLLLFTFQSPQIAAPRIPSRLYSCIQWEKQNGVCLFHLTKNQNSTPDFWAGELTCWKFRFRKHCGRTE